MSKRRKRQRADETEDRVVAVGRWYDEQARQDAHMRALHGELRQHQSGPGDLLMPHKMRAERVAERTGRDLSVVLADFPRARKGSVMGVQKFVGPDGRTIFLPVKPR